MRHGNEPRPRDNDSIASGSVPKQLNSMQGWQACHQQDERSGECEAHGAADERGSEIAVSTDEVIWSWLNTNKKYEHVTKHRKVQESDRNV